MKFLSPAGDKAALLIRLRCTAGDEEDFKPKESDLDAYLAREVVRGRDDCMPLVAVLTPEYQARRVAENGEDDSDDEDDEWAEEVLFESPLDKMDAYVEFSQRLYRTSALFL